jgi:hypothetical protein
MDAVVPRQRLRFFDDKPQGCASRGWSVRPYTRGGTSVFLSEAAETGAAQNPDGPASDTMGKQRQRH